MRGLISVWRFTFCCCLFFEGCLCLSVWQEENGKWPSNEIFSAHDQVSSQTADRLGDRLFIFINNCLVKERWGEARCSFTVIIDCNFVRYFTNFTVAGLSHNGGYSFYKLQAWVIMESAHFTVTDLSHKGGYSFYNYRLGLEGRVLILQLQTWVIREGAHFTITDPSHERA